METTAGAWAPGSISCFIHGGHALPAGNWRLSVYAQIHAPALNSGTTLMAVKYAVDTLAAPALNVSFPSTTAAATRRTGTSYVVTLDTSGRGNWQFHDTFNIGDPLDLEDMVGVGLSFYREAETMVESSWSWSWRLQYLG